MSFPKATPRDSDAQTALSSAEACWYQSLDLLLSEDAESVDRALPRPAMAITGGEGRILAHNHHLQQLFGGPTGNAHCGQRLVDLIRDVATPRNQLNDETDRNFEIDEICGGFGMPDVELRLNTPDERDYQLRSSPLLVPADNNWLWGRLWILTDITDERRLRDHRMHNRILRANSQLAGGVAHEISNALTVVIGHLELARCSPPASPDAHDSVPPQTGMMTLDAHLDAAEGCAWKIHQLVRELTQFGQRQKPVLGQNSPRSIVEQTSAELLAALPSGISVTTSIADELWQAIYDSNVLAQCLRLICRSAINDLPDSGGSLVLTADNFVSPPNGREWVRISILDRCQRHLADSVPHDYYMQMSEDHSGGTLALWVAMASNLADEMGGQLSVSAQPPDGREITVLIPRFRPPNEKTRSAGGTPLTILVVDDDATIRSVCRHLLESCGHRFISASGGRDALTILESRSDVDLVLLDEIMPGLTGHDTLEQMRIRGIDLPVVISSGHPHTSPSQYSSETSAVQNAANFMRGNGVYQNSPVVGVLPKPYRLQDLRSMLAETQQQVRP